MPTLEAVSWMFIGGYYVHFVVEFRAMGKRLALYLLEEKKDTDPKILMVAVSISAYLWPITMIIIGLVFLKGKWFERKEKK